MKNFIINFLENYLFIGLLILATLIILSFKCKKVRKLFIGIISFSIICLSIYQLHLSNIINSRLYEFTCELICLLIHSFEVIISLTFKIESNIFSIFDYNGSFLNFIYSIGLISNFHINLNSIYIILNYFINKYNNFELKIKKIVYFIQEYYYNKLNLVKSNIIMNC